MITRMDQTIAFGKYTGQDIGTILINDPSYVGWLCYATDILNFPDEIYHQVFSQIKLHAKNFFAQDQLVKFLHENPNSLFEGFAFASGMFFPGFACNINHLHAI